MRVFPPGHVESGQPTPDYPGLTIGHIAHELNSLLDGSMRCLALAQHAINEDGESADELDVSIVDRLQFAHTGLARMAKLLQRAMQSPRVDLSIFDDRQSFQARLPQIVASLNPLAREHGIELEIHLSAKAAAAPIATLGPVIRNGLRNAIESCVRGCDGPRCVECSIQTTAAGQLHIVIADSGGGLPDDFDADASAPHDGHGFGLDLSRRIVHELGGEVRLMSVPFGSGAVLDVLVPLGRLNAGE